MRNLKETIAVIILIFLFSLRGFSQYEKYDAVYDQLTREYTLNPDGSMDYRFIKKQKLQTYRAFHNLYGETFVVYDTINQQLKINEVYTTMADGKKVVAPGNAFNPALPGFAASAPAYNSLREMVITHTGLERGATVNLDYQVHTNRGVIPFLTGNELLAENEPVRQMELKIRIPEGSKLGFKLLNCEDKPVQTKENGFSVYTWKRMDVPAISAEDWQPGGNMACPRLIFSTAGNPDEIFSRFTSQAAFRYELSPAMKSYVARTLEEKKNPVDFVLRIQELVADEVRLYPIPLPVALFSCRSAEQTWNSNGGTLPEKGILMTALLRQAGLDARLTGIARTALLDKKVANLLSVDDFCVRVDMKEKGVWYLSLSNLNSVNLKYFQNERTFLVFGKDGKVTEEPAEAPRQMVKVNGNFLVSSDPKLTGEVSIYTEGQSYPGIGMFRDKQKIRSSLTGQLIKNDSVNLKKSALNNENGYQVYTVQSDKPFRKDTNFFYFRLPVISSGVDSWNLKTMSEKRETAFEIPAMADESYNYTFSLPVDLALHTPGKKQTISNKAGTFTFEVKLEKGKILVYKSIKFSDVVFPVADYPDLKVLMDSWNNPWNRQLIFREGVSR